MTSRLQGSAIAPTYSSHQLSYFAHQLTLRAASDSMECMVGALLVAQVELFAAEWEVS